MSVCTFDVGTGSLTVADSGVSEPILGVVGQNAFGFAAAKPDLSAARAHLGWQLVQHDVGCDRTSTRDARARFKAGGDETSHTVLAERMARW
mmetsp:Transcript_49019/g.127960  ORF Transcript_49019/g.127960 Transcript_49019/m.127960 type:complete len:92 (+) Transcript_49019:267-542(+)